MKKSRLVLVSVVLSLALVFGVAFAANVAGPVVGADKDAKTFVVKAGDKDVTLTAADDNVFRKAGKQGREVDCATEEKEGKVVATDCKITKAAPGC
jgi:hypothetical protein